MIDSQIKPRSSLTKKFDRAANRISDIVGSPFWFFFSVLIVLVWFPTGFIIGFNEIWHLHINSTTTILTFLMMSLLHASQKRWEKRMEERLKREGTTLKTLKQETEQISKQNINQQNQ